VTDTSKDSSLLQYGDNTAVKSFIVFAQGASSSGWSQTQTLGKIGQVCQCILLAHFTDTKYRDFLLNGKDQYD